MFAIVISACLVADPGVCKDYRIPLDEQISSARCMLDAQPHFAKWMESHPGWQITRWKCAPSNVQDL